LNPNSQECQQLAQKIQNKLDNIYKRMDAMQLNPGNLPDYAPGPPRNSVAGHQGLVEKDWQDVLKDVDLYGQKCGGGTGSPSSSLPVSLPGRSRFLNFSIPDWVLPVAVGGAGACALIVPGCAEVEAPFVIPVIP
jgi:hypothetical protein